MNHEYVDDGLLHRDGMATWSARQGAQGAGRARRLGHRGGAARTAAGRSCAPRRGRAASPPRTPMAVRRPGRRPRRCCAPPPTRAGRACSARSTTARSGITPWGTYLTCEENFTVYFKGPDQPDAHQARWGLRKGDPAGYRWHEHDERFDAAKHPERTQPLRLDRRDRSRSTRAARRSSAPRWAAPRTKAPPWRSTRDGRAVVYIGRGRALRVHLQVRQPRPRAARRLPRRTPSCWTTARLRRALRRRRHAAAGCRWRTASGPLTAGQRLRRPGRGADQDPPGERPAGRHQDGPPGVDRGRPAGLGLLHADQQQQPRRGQASRASTPPTRAPTTPWATSSAGRKTATTTAARFQWNHFVLAGDPANERAEAKGNVKGDAFGCPDGLWVDAPRRAVDPDRHVAPRAMGKGDLARLGNNAMLAADPRTGEIRRFLDRPAGLRDHRRHRHARRPHDVHQHPAPGREPRASAATRTQPRALFELAGPAPERPAALGDGGDPQGDGGPVGT